MKLYRTYGALWNGCQCLRGFKPTPILFRLFKAFGKLFTIQRNIQNCNVEIAILLSKKEFLKNSSLVTRNAVSRYALGVYNADSPYATRHPTRHQNLCILLIIWALYA